MIINVIQGTFGYDASDQRIVTSDHLHLITSGSSVVPILQNTDPNGICYKMMADSGLQNFGTLLANGIGVQVEGTGAQIANSGLIFGGHTAIRALYASTISNQGTLTAGEAGVVFAGGAGGAASLQNSGTIQAAYAVLATEGVPLASLSLTNTGSLLGASGTAIAVDAAQSVAVTNTGLVDGDVQMRADTSLRLANSGTIRGDVYLLSYTEDASIAALYNGLGQGLVTGTVYGSESADRLFGASAEDRLNGDEGADILRGRGGDDDLTGGRGADRLYGGAGEDSFIYTTAADSRAEEGVDVIFGFARDQDVIDLSALAGTGRFIGTRGFTSAGQFEVRAVLNKKTHVETILIDQNGDGRADMVLSLRGQYGLITDDDFLF